MPTTVQSITQASNNAASSGFLDLMGEDRGSFDNISLDNIAASIDLIAAIYVKKLVDGLDKKDVSSSGKLADSIKARDIIIVGDLYTVEIEAFEYASYIDEGVNGVVQSRGSRFQFKTLGIHPDSAITKAVKSYIDNAGDIRTNTKVQVSNRERKRATIKDITLVKSMQMAYLIKRMGIHPNHFWRDATIEMEEVVKTELKKALKHDMLYILLNK